eukprot:6177148-Pleurochrysis_carterae.AAC.3
MERRIWVPEAESKGKRLTFSPLRETILLICWSTALKRSQKSDQNMWNKNLDDGAWKNFTEIGPIAPTRTLAILPSRPQSAREPTLAVGASPVQEGQDNLQEVV